MRKVVGCALVLVLVAAGAWWASRRADGAATVEPPGSREIAQAAPPALELAGAAPAERSAVAQSAVGDGEALPRLAARPGFRDLPAATPPATLEGRVVDASGDAVSARVELVHAETGASHATEMDLSYRFDGVEPGPWWVRVTNDAHLPTSARIVLEPGRNHADFVLSGLRTLEVHLVTRSGEPLVHALAASGQTPWMPYVFATLEPPGGARLDGGHRDWLELGWFEDGQRLVQPRSDRTTLPTSGAEDRPDPRASASWVGTLHLSVDPPLHVAVASPSHVLDVVRVEPGATEVTLQVDVEDLHADHASLRMRIVAADTDESLSKGTLVWLLSWAATTTGRLAGNEHRFDELVPGRYELQVVRPGYVGVRRPIELAPGEERDAGTIALERVGSRTGRVLDPLGRGVVAQVEIGPAQPRTSSLVIRSGRVDGRFELPIAHADGLELRVRPSEFEGFAEKLGSKVVHVAAEHTDDVVVQLARCSRLVLRPSGPEQTGVRYEVVDEHGNRYARGYFNDPVPVAIELPEGWYEVVLVDRTGAERRRAVQLGEQPSVIDV